MQQLILISLEDCPPCEMVKRYVKEHKIDCKDFKSYRNNMEEAKIVMGLLSQAFNKKIASFPQCVLIDCSLFNEDDIKDIASFRKLLELLKPDFLNLLTQKKISLLFGSSEILKYLTEIHT